MTARKKAKRQLSGTLFTIAINVFRSSGAPWNTHTQLDHDRIINSPSDQLFGKPQVAVSQASISGRTPKSRISPAIARSTGVLVIT